MIQLSETSSTKSRVLSESELTQVVGGRGHARHRGGDKHGGEIRHGGHQGNDHGRGRGRQVIIIINNTTNIINNTTFL